jgi:hypothetical protein
MQNFLNKKDISPTNRVSCFSQYPSAFSTNHIFCSVAVDDLVTANIAKVVHKEFDPLAVDSRWLEYYYGESSDEI